MESPRKSQVVVLEDSTTPVYSLAFLSYKKVHIFHVGDNTSQARQRQKTELVDSKSQKNNFIDLNFEFLNNRVLPNTKLIVLNSSDKLLEYGIFSNVLRTIKTGHIFAVNYVVITNDNQLIVHGSFEYTVRVRNSQDKI